MDTLSMLLPLLVAVLGFSSVHGDSCSDKCQFDKPCTKTDYIQHNPCSYSCVCDGEYTYHEEDTFTQCGRGKRCYQGDCLTEVPNLCESVYGNNYLGLLNPSNPCVYNCLNIYSPCIVYEENVVNGGRCYTYSNSAGNCFNGRCAAGGFTFGRALSYDEDRKAAAGGDGSADGSYAEDRTGYNRGDRVGRFRGSKDGSGDPSPTNGGGASSEGDGTTSATRDRKTTTTGDSMAYGGGSGSTYPENLAATTEGTRSGSETTTEGSGTGSTTEDRTTILSNDQGASFIGNRGRVDSATSSAYGVAYASGAGDRRASATSGALTESGTGGSLTAATGTASAEGSRAKAAAGALTASRTGSTIAAAGGTAFAEGGRSTADSRALTESNRGGEVAAARGTASADGRRAKAATGALTSSGTGRTIAAARGTASAEGGRSTTDSRALTESNRGEVAAARGTASAEGGRGGSTGRAGGEATYGSRSGIARESYVYNYGDPGNYAYSGNYANNGGNYFYETRDYSGDAGANGYYRSIYPYSEYEGFLNGPIYSSDIDPSYGNYDYEVYRGSTGSAGNAGRNYVAASRAAARSNYGGIDGDEGKAAADAGSFSYFE